MFSIYQAFLIIYFFPVLGVQRPNPSCSPAKFVAILIVLLVFFFAIFRSTDVSSGPFDFLYLKTG